MDDIEITGTVTDSIREMLRQDGRNLGENLKESFLSTAILALFHARRNAGLTQVQVAERMNTTQSAIARLENDLSGSLSLRRYVDYCLACGVAPLDMTLEPVARLRDYVLHDPNAPRTPGSYVASQATNALQSLFAHRSPASEATAYVSAHTTRQTILNPNVLWQQVTPPSPDMPLRVTQDAGPRQPWQQVTLASPDKPSTATVSETNVAHEISASPQRAAA